MENPLLLACEPPKSFIMGPLSFVSGFSGRGILFCIIAIKPSGELLIRQQFQVYYGY